MRVPIIESTGDINQDVLRDFAFQADLANDVEISDSQFIMRAAEPPSWISLIAQSSWWLKVFYAASGLYVAELIKEAAKESWSNRAAIFKRVASATNSITKLGTAFLSAKSKCKSHTHLVIGLPIPDETYTTCMHINSGSLEEISAEVALFVHHLPAVIDYLEGPTEPPSHALGWISLRITDSCGIEVKYMHRESLETITHTIPLTWQA